MLSSYRDRTYHSRRSPASFRPTFRPATRCCKRVDIAGELERGFNEAIVFDRQGREMGRYTKIAQTTSQDSKYYRAGDRVGVFDLDFGRVVTKICLDVSQHEIDRVAALHQVDLMLLSTQDAGPYSESILLRDNHRAMDNGYYLLRAAGGGAESDHRPISSTLGASCSPPRNGASTTRP
ncbi:MAG: carbon-nitrogen hydrolase family protein [Rhodopirellula sp.]|nr:carbon-nitrogen hydrolase family protein [Rhodopirellula sp.]